MRKRRYHRGVRRAESLRLAFELAAIAAIALLGLPLPAAGALLIVAAISLALGGERFAEVGPAWTIGAGVAVGAAAAVTVVLAAAPLLESAGGVPVAFTIAPVVRGNAGVFLAAAILAGAVAVAGELALRGWLLPRLLRLGLAPALAIAAVALVEVAVTPGAWPQRAGAAAIGVGASLLATAGAPPGQARVGAPIAAAVTLQVLLLAVEWQKLRG